MSYLLDSYVLVVGGCFYLKKIASYMGGFLFL
jgi:hypothetical protein